MVGLGGVFGGLMGGWFTQVGLTNYVFLIEAGVTALLAISGLLISKESEEGSSSRVQMSLGERTKANFSDIYKGIRLK